MAELLIELFSEEIPARMQAKAVADFTKFMTEMLSDNGILTKDNKKSKAECFVTPRRLTFFINDLPANFSHKSEDRRGPEVNAPKQAIDGFLKSTGLKSVNDLSKTKTDKGIYYLYKSKETKVKTTDLLIKNLPAVFQKMSNTWAKTMRWGEGNPEIKWVRPLRNILCIFDGKTVPLEFMGLKSNNETRGHRFLGKKGDIKISNFNDYKKTLAKNFVVLDQNERQKIISSGIDKLCKQYKVSALKQDLNVENPNSLINEAVGIVEYPEVLVGKIADYFMTLPREVLITTVKNHQRYFCLNNEDGELSSNFIFVSNMKTKDNGKMIVEGNEKVLKARLSDAKFYIDEDLKTPLFDRVPELKNIVFHEKVGSIYEKMKRVEQLAKYVSMWIPHSDLTLINRAAMLAKTDLVTHGVSELPELQGYMGSYYAKEQGENEEISKAIEEHYLPTSKDGELPRSPLGIALSIADKMDTIVSMFLVDEKPTSSKDPFALRRATIGIIRIILGHKLPIPLKLLINKSLVIFASSIYKAQKKENKESTKTQKLGTESEVLEFFNERLKAFLKEIDCRTDVINSIFGDSYKESLEHEKQYDILDLASKAIEINDFMENSESKEVMSLYKRAVNIIKTEEKANGEKYDDKPNARLFKTPEEEKLYDYIKEIKPDIKELAKKGQFIDALNKLASLQNYLTEFFDKVVVNCEKKSLKENRLQLLGQVRSLFDMIMDFSEIEIS